MVANVEAGCVFPLAMLGRTMNRERRLGAALAVLGLLIAGCGGGEGDAAPREGGQSTHTTEDPTPSATGTPSEGADPATGRLIRQESGVRLHAPEGWAVEEFTLDIWQAIHPRGRGVLSFADLGTIPGRDLRSLLRNSLRGLDGKPDVSYDVELDGAPGYLATGVRASDALIEYGAIQDDRAVVITFQFNDDEPRSRRTAVAESVAASFQWQ